MIKLREIKDKNENIKSKTTDTIAMCFTYFLVTVCSTVCTWLPTTLQFGLRKYFQFFINLRVLKYI